MKKILTLVLTLFCLLSLAACQKTFVGHDGLLETAREEIKEDMELSIAGSVDKDGRSLVWFITGNDFQSHNYYPIEFEVDEDNNDHFRFVHGYKAYQRGQDIVSYPWKGYCFLVNNEACKSISLTYSDGRTEEIPVGQLPFLHHTAESSLSYSFLDAEGKVLPE